MQAFFHFWRYTKPSTKQITRDYLFWNQVRWKKRLLKFLSYLIRAINVDYCQNLNYCRPIVNGLLVETYVVWVDLLLISLSKIGDSVLIYESMMNSSKLGILRTSAGAKSRRKTIESSHILYKKKKKTGE